MQVDAIEQWTRDTLAIALDLNRAATAFALQITKISARTGIHRRNEHEFRWKGETARRARDRESLR